MFSSSKGIAGVVSEVRRSGGELSVEWRIPRFLDLPCGNWDCYESPRFRFRGARWHFDLRPNLPTLFPPPEGRMSLSLLREDEGGPRARTVNVSTGVKGPGGVEKRREAEFGKKECWSLGTVCARSELVEQEQRLLPDGALTFAFKIRVPHTAARDAFTQTDAAEFREARVPVDDKQSSEKRGIEKVAEDMEKLLFSGKKSDITVQVQDTEFRVHSSVLCARSPVLSAMLEHDTAERASHRITINDCQPGVFGEYLRYLYTGSVQSLSHRTVFDLYRVANQCLADDLKLLCLEHVRDTLCVQTFCDTVQLALMHGESDLLQRALHFATQNLPSVVASVEWQNFICEYPREANEILVQCLGPRS